MTPNPCTILFCPEPSQEWPIAGLMFCAAHYENLREAFREAIQNE